MSIYATLHTHPTNSLTHEVIYVTRGASAELLYPLYDKVFRFEDVEQITFTFKQGRAIYWYSMFNALKNGKIELDPHFYHFEGDYATIVLNLDGEETKQFKPGIPVEYEITVKLNTDSLATFGNKDSILIEPQHPLEVRDSLYSKI